MLVKRYVIKKGFYYVKPDRHRFRLVANIKNACSFQGIRKANDYSLYIKEHLLWDNMEIIEVEVEDKQDSWF